MKKVSYVTYQGNNNIFCITKFITKAKQKKPQKRAASNPSRLPRRESDRVLGVLLIGFASASIVVVRQC